MSEKIIITVESLATVNEFLQEHTNYSLHVSDNGELFLAQSMKVIGDIGCRAYAKARTAKILGGRKRERMPHHYFLIAQAYDNVLQEHRGVRPRGYINAVRSELQKNFGKYISRSNYFIAGDQCNDEYMFLSCPKGERKRYSLSDNVISKAVLESRSKFLAKEKN